MMLQRMTNQQKELINRDCDVIEKLAFINDCSIDTIISIMNNRTALEIAYESVLSERYVVQQILTDNFETPVDYYNRFSELYDLQINDGMIVGL